MVFANNNSKSLGHAKPISILFKLIDQNIDLDLFWGNRNKLSFHLILPGLCLSYNNVHFFLTTFTMRGEVLTASNFPIFAAIQK